MVGLKLVVVVVVLVVDLYSASSSATVPQMTRQSWDLIFTTDG